MATPDSTIGGLPRAESINDDSLLVMEQQGEAKSVEAQALAEYAVRKAKAGQSDWLAAEGQSGHVLNRTHHKVVKMEPFEVDPWELEAAGVPYYDLSAVVGEGFTIFQIRETALTREQLDGAQVEYSGGDRLGYGDVEYDAEVSELFSTTAGGTIEAYKYSTMRPSVSMDSDFGFIFVIPNDLEVPGIGTIVKGTYLKPGQNAGITSRWKFKNEVYSRLEEAYIPPVDVHRFLYSSLEGYDYDAYEVPVTVGSIWDQWTVNERFMNHLKQNKPVEITLNINDSAHRAIFLLHFPIRNDWNDLYMEQVIYSCDLGVLFIEFKVERTQLTIKVDNLADKMGCITSADTVNVAEEGM